MHKLFGTENSPFHWLPIDFASLLFATGRDPEALVKGEALCKEFGIDYGKYTIHNALDDARLLRDVYRAMKGSRSL